MEVVLKRTLALGERTRVGTSATYGFSEEARHSEYGVGKDEPRGIGAPVDNFCNLEISTCGFTPKVLPISAKFLLPLFRLDRCGLTNTCLGALHLAELSRDRRLLCYISSKPNGVGGQHHASQTFCSGT